MRVEIKPVIQQIAEWWHATRDDLKTQDMKISTIRNIPEPNVKLSDVGLKGDLAEPSKDKGWTMVSFKAQVLKQNQYIVPTIETKHHSKQKKGFAYVCNLLEEQICQYVRKKGERPVPESLTEVSEY